MSNDCCLCFSREFCDAVLTWLIHWYSIIAILFVRCFCCCWRCIGGKSTLDSAINEKVGICMNTGMTDGRFSRSLEHFICTVRCQLGWKESLFKFDDAIRIPKRPHSVTIVLVPSATRLGIDVDHALDEIKSNQAWDAHAKVILVLHQQAPHLPDVRPSRLQLTDEKYANLAAILDLQIHDGRMRICPLNKSMAKELSTLLLRQQAEIISESQPLRN